jgi:hypothetical protein
MPQTTNNPYVSHAGQFIAGAIFGSIGGYLDIVHLGKPYALILGGTLTALQIIDFNGYASMPWNSGSLPIHLMGKKDEKRTEKTAEHIKVQTEDDDLELEIKLNIQQKRPAQDKNVESEKQEPQPQKQPQPQPQAKLEPESEKARGKRRRQRQKKRQRLTNQKTNG